MVGSFEKHQINWYQYVINDRKKCYRMNMSRYSSICKGIWVIYNDGFKWLEGYILEIDIQYPKKLQDFQTNLPVLAESMKIEKVQKLRA